MGTQLQAKLLALAPIAFAVLVALGSLAYLNHQHRALSDALRDAEAARLELHNQTVEHDATRRQLQGSVDDLLKDNAELRAAFDAAMAASPGASPASVSRLDTGPLPVRRVTRVPHAETPGARSGAPVQPEPAPGGATQASGGAPCPDCLVVMEDRLSIAVEEIELTTQENNTIMVGTAMVYLEDPRRLLASGRFQSALSQSSQLAQPTPPRWGAEVVGLCTGAGCGLGGGVLLPPTRFLGLRWEARAGALAGPVLAAYGALGARW